MTDTFIDMAPWLISPDYPCKKSASCLDCPVPDDCDATDTIYCNDEERPARDALIIGAWERSKKYREMSEEFGLTNMQLSRIVRRYKEATHE